MSGNVDPTKIRIIETLGKTGWRTFGPETKLAVAGGPRTFGDVILALMDAGIVEQRRHAADQIVEYRLVRPETAATHPIACGHEDQRCPTAPEQSD